MDNPKYTYDDYAKETADRFIRMLKEGTTPYQKQWKGEDLSASMPRNGLTGIAYKGSNSGDLWMKQIDMGYTDPRWLTIIQAKKIGAQINKGEKHTKIIHWNMGREIDRLDENGKPILDENGEKQTVYQKYAVPSFKVFQVFNANQFSGIAPLTKEELTPKREFIPIEIGEIILKNSGAIINFDERGRSAHYSPSKDEITLPSKELFSSEMAYYSTALHELGHWTGHESRLARDLSNPFGTDGYAKEELRAEIASFMLSSELGIDFDPTNHGAYVASWCRNLEEEPKEIFKASADAVKITNYVMALALEKEKEVEKMQELGDTLNPKKAEEILFVNSLIEKEKNNEPITQDEYENTISIYKDDMLRKGFEEFEFHSWDDIKTSPETGLQHIRDVLVSNEVVKDFKEGWDYRNERMFEKDLGIELGKVINQEKIYPKILNVNAKYPNATILHVPYKEKDLAGSLGARWEQSEKTWVAPIGVDLTKLAPWLVAPQKEVKEVVNPVTEFAIALKDRGLILDGEPIMDGKLYRVSVEGDKGKQKSGSYTGHLDGRPAGFINNFKEGIVENWKAQSFNQDNVVSLNPTPEQQEAQKVLNAEKEVQRQKEQLAKHNEISVNVRTKFNEAREVGDSHPYLDEKGVKNYGLKLDERNNLLMPLKDIDDKIWTAQAINKGFKGFEKGGKKEGNFFTIGEHHSTSKELLICEGYATGASIHEATGKGVIVAVDAGNLENVGLILRERYPDKVIAFMADDDIAKATDGKTNVGLFSAETASEMTRGIVIYPQLTSSEIKDGKSDFNDIHKSRGLAELKAQLSTKMDKLFVREDKAPPQKEKTNEKGLVR